MRRFVFVVTAVTASVLGMAGVSGARPAAVAGHAPRGVRHVRVVRAGSTQVVLSWRNPTSRSFAATTVVVRPGAHAARHVGGFGRRVIVSRHRHSVTVRDLAPSTRYAFALFASDGHGHYSRRVAISAPTTPAPVTHLHTYTVRNGASVHWQNPTVRTFDHAVVRYVKGPTAPAVPSKGHPVRLVTGLANAARVTGLAPDTRYSAAVWAVDREGRYSAAQTATFVSSGARPTPGTYRARVVDDAGHPLLNAEVYAFDEDDFASDTEVTTTSALDGRFSLSLPPGEWYVGVGGQHISGGDSDPTGYVETAQDVVVRAGSSLDDGDLVLEPGGAVTGRVTDTSGRPLAGADVYLPPVQAYVQTGDSDGSIFAFGEEYESFPTASDGTYTVKGVSTTAAVRLCVTADGAEVDGTNDTSTYTDRCLPASLVASSGSVSTEGTLALDSDASGVVAGRVRAPDGSGVDDAYVSFQGPDRQYGGYTQTDRDGRYRLSGLAAGTYRVCSGAQGQPRSSRTGYAARCAAHAVVVAPGRASRAYVRLGVGAAVTGKITGAGGVPVAGVLVELRGPGADPIATTDARGHYRAKGLATGEFTACVVNTSYATARGMPSGVLPGCFGRRTHVGARAGAVRNGVDVRLAVAGAISGTVRDSAGNPVAYAEVDVETTNFEGEGGFARADARGRYVVRGLAADRYDVCFTAVSDDLDTLTRCRRGTVDVRIGQVVRRVDGVIPTVESMTVSVVDAQGEPVAGVDAVALAPCDDACDTPPLFGGHLNTEVFASGVTDSQGAAGLNNLAPGRYAVCLFSVFATTADGGAPDGYADRCSGNTFDVIVKKGATSAVSLTLEDGGAVTGTVVDGSGNPIRGVLVHVTGSAADDYSDITDEDFFPPGLPAGVPGDPGDPTSDSVTRADGTYTVRSVPTGGAGVCAQADNAVGPNPAGYFDRCLGAANGSTSGGTRVTVRADTTSPVDDIVLSPASAISGRIVTAARRTPVPYADVVVLSAPHGYEVTEMLTDADGAYQVTRLRPGRYFVCVFSFDLQSQCYRGVPWDPHAEAPPVRGSTAVITTAGAITTGIGFRLAALKHR